MKEKRTYYLIANTPVHPGGSEQLDIVDLPIQRERHTKYPKIEASSLKGTLRSIYSQEIYKTDKNTVILLFGDEPEAKQKNEDNAASLAISDARILFFPVKSIKNTFVWITCPAVLHKYFRDTKHEIDVNLTTLNPNSNTAIIPSDSSLLVNKNTLLLEEYAFTAYKKEEATKLACYFADHIFTNKDRKYWKNKFKKDLVILSDEDFEAFVVNSTEIITRIQIDSKTRVVSDKALFNEEYLPEDTILYFIMTPIPPPKYNKSETEIITLFEEKKPEIIQVGANATLGKGYMEFVTHNENHTET